MGMTRDMQLEEDEEEQAARLECQTCGNEMDEVGEPQDPFLICGHCEDEKRGADTDEMIDEIIDEIISEMP